MSSFFSLTPFRFRVVPLKVDYIAECKSPEGPRDNLRLWLFSRSGFTKEVEARGRKGEIEPIDVRKIGL